VLASPPHPQTCPGPVTTSALRTASCGAAAVAAATRRTAQRRWPRLWTDPPLCGRHRGTLATLVMGNGCGVALGAAARTERRVGPEAAAPEDNTMVESMEPIGLTSTKIDSGLRSSTASTAACDKFVEPLPGLVDEDEGDQALKTPRPFEAMTFSAEERFAAWSAAGKDDATGVHEHPVALWIIGPSAVGKSTVAEEVGPDFGVMPKRVPPADPNNGCALDAVLVDGEFFRRVHSEYQAWAKSKDWYEAYPTLKPVINNEKAEMLKASALERKHVVIPQTCLNLASCLNTQAELRRLGYTNHVLAVTAPREEVARRGRAREAEEGKRYAPSEYDHSIAAFGPMIAACNGRYTIVRAREPPRENGCRRLLREVLSTGVGGADGGCEPDLSPELLMG